MRRYLKLAVVTALVAGLCVPAWAYIEYATSTGATVGAAVLMWLSGGNATPVTTSDPLPVGSTPGSLTIIPLDVSSVTTGGVAVTALTAGHRNKGGWIHNPVSATVNLCINEQAAASGTTSAGPLTCIQHGQTYTLAPSSGPVSVISSDSAHIFSGQGFN